MSCLSDASATTWCGSSSSPYSCICSAVSGAEDKVANQCVNQPHALMVCSCVQKCISLCNELGRPPRHASVSPILQFPHFIVYVYVCNSIVMYFERCSLQFAFLCIRHALPCPALPCPALPCLTLPCPALPCPAMPCPALPLPCVALPCPALAMPCPALPCPALACPATHKFN